MGFLLILKSRYSLLFCSVLFIGCYSTYRLSEFPSRQKFYNKFNESVKDRSVKIVLTNDSSFVIPNGAEISNDTLFISNQIQKEKRLIPKSEIKNIQYYFESYNSTYSATILLNDGERLSTENVELLPDSSVLCNPNKGLSLTKIKQISYKNRLLGGILGLAYGIAPGFIAGELISTTVPSTGRGGVGSQALTNSYLEGITIVPLASAILGAILGYTYTYEFSP